MAYTRALEIAVSIDDAEYRLRALWGLYTYHNVSGRYRVALELAQRFLALAAERPDPNDRLTGEGMIGVAEHFSRDPAQREAPSGTRARWLRHSRTSVAHCSLSD